MIRSFVNVFILGDNSLRRDTLVGLVKQQSDLHVVAAPPSSQGAVEEILRASPDILLWASAGGHLWEGDLLLALRRRIPRLKTLLVEMDENEEISLQAFRSGVAGYLLRGTPSSVIVAAVWALARGETVCPPRLCLHVLRSMAGQRTVMGDCTSGPSLIGLPCVGESQSSSKRGLPGNERFELEGTS